MRYLQGRGNLSPEQALERLGDRTLRISMQTRGIDTIGTTDLLLYKFILAHQGVDSPGLPVTNTFCIEQRWVFEVSRASDPDAIEFISKDYGINSVTKGPMELKPMKSGQSVNWVLGHFFRLHGVKFECLPVDPVVSVGGMESSNMLIGAATAAGSILTGADYDLGTTFTLATMFENEVHRGLTGGQGLAAGIVGGAHMTEWAAHIHPYAGISTELFGPEQYPDFEAHVSFLLPGRQKGGRSSLDVNRKWTEDALTEEGRKLQAIFTELSREAAAGFANSGGVDWLRVATAAQRQTNVRVASCPAFFDGIEDLARRLVVKEGDRVLRAVTRPGAGGYGTPVVVYSATAELAEEARAIVGNELVVTEDTAAEMKRTGIIHPGWLRFRLSAEPIQFEGFTEAGFNNPERPVEVVSEG